MNIILKNNTALDIEIEDLSSFLLTASGTETITNYFSDVELSKSDDLIAYVATEDISVNDGVEDLLPTIAIKKLLGDFGEVKIVGTAEDVVLNSELREEYRDRSGKLRVHQTSRKLGTMIMWTGVGDDTTVSTTVGGGESFSFGHFTGDDPELIKYVDFNMTENETWLHEGYITWCKAKLDTLSLSVVPRVTETVTSSGTSYALYGGYLVVPIYTVGGVPGDGTIDVTSDLTLHTGGLVYIPDNDLGEPPTAFWDAEWDTTTKRYKNITPAPTGNGRYNLFAVEVTIAKFVRDMTFLDSGFIALNSSDTDQLGQGLRLKMHAKTNTTISGVGDHDWSLACTMCLHREKSV